MEEISHQNLYRHVIINDRLPAAKKELIDIVGSYREKQPKGV